ncbi:hypothetical protein M3Y99_01612800 [Aphelenchoides fujianensis]|nr:hypothetical protein M3Y99_01612800 [Aphelenchoides fujianensis]
MADGGENAEDLERKVEAEAARVFKHLAVDAITLNDERFDLGFTYQMQLDEMDPLDIVAELGVEGIAPTFLQPVISAETGEILDYEERWNVQAETGADASHSMALNRAPDPAAFASVVGKRGNLPFLPGGFEDEVDSMLKLTDVVCNEEERPYLEFNELLNQPPAHAALLELPERVEKIVNAAAAPKPLEFPPGVELPFEPSAYDDLFAPSNLSAAANRANLEKLAAGVKNVVIKDGGNEADGADDQAADEQNEEVEDLGTDARDADKEYTHAKFLSDDKVRKRYDQIRPIMAKTASSGGKGEIRIVEWSGRIKQRKITVIQTLKRPVPLEHFLYTGHNGKSRDELFMIMDKDGMLLKAGYEKAVQAKAKLVRVPDPRFNQPQVGGGGRGPNNQNQQQQRNHRGAGNRFQHQQMQQAVRVHQSIHAQQPKRSNYAVDRSVYSNLTAFLQQRDFLPSVVFVFSRKRCDDNANMMDSADLTTAKEKSEISRFFNRCIDRLKGSDKILPQVQYTQMAGRAGRRGLDATGIVIILAKRDLPPITHYSQLLTGKAVRLESRFRVTYAMLLKLLRVEQFRIEDLLQRSYIERSSLRLVTTRKNRITELDEQIRALPSTDCPLCLEPAGDSPLPSLEEYMNDLRAYLADAGAVWPLLVESVALGKTLSKGRILLVNYPPLGLVGRLGVVLNMKRDEHGRDQLVLFIAADEARREEENLELKAWGALNEEDRQLQTNTLLLPQLARNGLFHVNNPRMRSYRVIPDFELKNIVAICKQSLKNVDVDAVLKEDARRNNSFKPRSPDRAVSRLLVELESLGEKWAVGGVPISLFAVDIKAKELGMHQHLNRLKELQDKLVDKSKYPCRQCGLFDNHFMDLLQREDLNDKLQTLKFQTSSNALLLSEEYQNRIYVLRAMDYVDKNNIIGLKGKVACEVSHLEVLITELILENKLDGKSCAELAAMLSPLTCQFTYAGSKDRDLNMEFKHPVNDLLRHDIVTVAQRIDVQQQMCGVHSSFIMDELRFGLMDVVYEWASGTPFHDIMLLTDCQEGLIVRCIQRLDEVCKDVRNAARIIGDPSLYEKMEEASTLIKRDIVFAASLYTTDE